MSRSVDLPMPGSPETRTRLAGTSPPPRTRSSSATPVGIRSASEASTSTSRSSGRPAGSGAAHAGRRGERALLDQRPPLPARGTAAEPLPGRVPALGACVLEGRLRHGRPSLGRRSDAEAARLRAGSVSITRRGSWPSRPRTPRLSGCPASGARRASRAARTCRPRAGAGRPGRGRRLLLRHLLIVGRLVLRGVLLAPGGAGQRRRCRRRPPSWPRREPGPVLVLA